MSPGEPWVSLTLGEPWSTREEVSQSYPLQGLLRPVDSVLNVNIQPVIGAIAFELSPQRDSDFHKAATSVLGPPPGLAYSGGNGNLAVTAATLFRPCKAYLVVFNPSTYNSRIECDGAIRWGHKKFNNNPDQCIVQDRSAK